MLNAAVLAVAVLAAAALFHPRLMGQPLWRATITPLASIIGSGFLVLRPVLDGLYGMFAPAAMAALCAVAFLFGRDPLQHRDHRGRRGPGRSSLPSFRRCCWRPPSAPSAAPPWGTPAARAGL